MNMCVDRAKKLVEMLTEDKEDLSESPIKIPNQDFNFSDKYHNQKYLNELLSDKRLIELELNTFKAGNCIFITGKQGNLPMVYLGRWKVDYFKAIKRDSITQFLVWRGRAMSGTPGRIFWKYIFPITNVAVSDRTQTENGQLFWFDRLEEAKAKGLHTYAINIRNPEILEIGKEVQYNELEAEFYGHETKFDAMRLCISKEPLK